MHKDTKKETENFIYSLRSSHIKGLNEKNISTVQSRFSDTFGLRKNCH